MSRYLPVIAIAVFMSTSAAFAADDAQTSPAAGADTSSGAKEQSSAPAGSKAEEDMSSGSSAGTSSNTSTGAKESSAAPGSSAADVTKATTKADCDKAGGMWNVQSSECAQDSAKMGKEEGTHEGANLGATPEDDTKKVDQPEHTTPN